MFKIFLSVGVIKSPSNESLGSKEGVSRVGDSLLNNIKDQILTGEKDKWFDVY